MGSNGTVLVTGAGGFVCSALCSALAEAGYSVRRAVRRVSTLDGATFAIGDVAANPDWSKALAGASVTSPVVTFSRHCDTHRPLIAYSQPRAHPASKYL